MISDKHVEPRTAHSAFPKAALQIGALHLHVVTNIEDGQVQSGSDINLNGLEICRRQTINPAGSPNDPQFAEDL